MTKIIQTDILKDKSVTNWMGIPNDIIQSISYNFLVAEIIAKVLILFATSVFFAR